MYCFGDFEFTFGKEIGNKSELISAGIIICDDDFNIIKRYYSTALPVLNPMLTKKCVELTKLKQSDINISRDSNDVCKDIITFMNFYNVVTIFVWGNFDKVAFLQDYNIHEKKKRDSEYIKLCRDRIVDIQRVTSSKLGFGKQAPGISTLMQAFSLQSSGEYHNAFVDCDALYQIYKIVYTGEYENIPSFKEFKLKKIKEKLEKQKEKDNFYNEYIKSLPDKEKSFIEENKKIYGNRVIKDFLKIRKKLYNTVSNSDNEDFVIYYFKDKRGIKIFEKNSPKLLVFNSKFSTEKISFKKENISDIYLYSLKRLADEYKSKYSTSSKKSNIKRRDKRL